MEFFEVWSSHEMEILKPNYRWICMHLALLEKDTVHMNVLIKSSYAVLLWLVCHFKDSYSVCTLKAPLPG